MPPQGLSATGRQMEVTLGRCGDLTLPLYCSRACYWFLAKDLKLRFKEGSGKRRRLELHVGTGCICPEHTPAALASLSKELSGS